MSNDSSHPFQSEAHYRLLRTKLVASLYRRSCTASEDTADEAVVRLITLAKIRELGNTDATAFGIAKNVFHEWLRESRRFAGLDDVRTGDSTPGSQTFRFIADIAIRQLDPADRDFLEEYFIDGKKAEDLASQMGITAVAVRGRVFRLRRHLRVVVGEMLGEPQGLFSRDRR